MTSATVRGYSLSRIGRMLRHAGRRGVHGAPGSGHAFHATIQKQTVRIHRALEAGAEAAEPSFIARPGSVTDGKWDSADVEAVDIALQDAERIARLGVKAGINSREVLLGQRAVDLEALVVDMGQPKYRAKQLTDAIYRKGVRTVDEIHTIPKAWKQALTARGVTVGRSELHHKVVSSCGTIKYLLKLADGYVVETVGIPERDGNRLTVCVSSEVGCPMRCTFCATGKGGFARNLLPHEIVDQVLLVQEQFGKRVRFGVDAFAGVHDRPYSHASFQHFQNTNR